MELTGQQLIPATLDITWVALNDPDTLKSCITGCESIEKTSESDYAVVMAVKIGPVNAKFKGKLTLTNLQPPQAYSIVFEGQGGIAGFGKGSANVKLTPLDHRTQLDYAAIAQVGGKIAQIGSRLVDAAARKIADEFFTALNKRLGGGAPGSAVAPGASGGTGTVAAATGGSGVGGVEAAPWVWPTAAASADGGVAATAVQTGAKEASADETDAKSSWFSRLRSKL